MHAVAYYLLLPFIYAVSYLPFPVLYGLSDILYVLLYKLTGYRKEVVYTNLRNAFPERSEAELQQIRRDFYRYFCDLIVEILKAFTIQPEVLRNRVSFTADAEALFHRLYREGKSLVVVMGHWGNWELAGHRFALEDWHPLQAIYHPLRNPYFDRLFCRMRARLGNEPIAMKDTLREMIRRRGEVTATVFLADQTPHNLQAAYWGTFMQQETPIYAGTERLARKFGYPVVYVGTRRIRRGYYEIDAELLVEHPEQMAEEAITALHTQRLEQDIREQPEIWLWTHRRWKHRRPKPIATQIRHGEND